MISPITDLESRAAARNSLAYAGAEPPISSMMARIYAMQERAGKALLRRAEMEQQARAEIRAFAKQKAFEQAQKEGSDSNGPRIKWKHRTEAERLADAIRFGKMVLSGECNTTWAAQQAGFTTSALYNLCASAGINIRANGRMMLIDGKWVKGGMRNEMIRMMEEGKTNKEIASHFSSSRSYVAQVRKDFAPHTKPLDVPGMSMRQKIHASYRNGMSVEHIVEQLGCSRDYALKERIAVFGRT